MCQSCVKVRHPDRGDLCLETGAYLANLSSCHGCGRKDTIVAADTAEETIEQGTQQITFKHVCSSCGHVVADHHYLFWIDDGYQNYQMNCLLCGHALDERSCMPQDPRKGAMLF